MLVVSYFRLHEVRWTIAEADLGALRARFTGIEFAAFESEDELAARIAEAEVFLGWHFPPALFERAPRLRWIHSASAGVEANLFPALVDSEVVLTNAAGLHAVSIPEHVLGLMLTLGRNLHEAQRLQVQHRWERFTVISYAGGVRELAGSSLAILGAGAIGASLARLAAGLGMRVRVMRRRPGRPVEGAEQVVGADQLHALLGWADFVVLATPLTPEIRHLIDAAALRAMKSSAYLINVARGEVIDDAALVEALRRGAIAGAGLDVATEEPLPADSPYWDLPNCVLTPHVSGYTPQYFEKALAMFTDNLARFVRGAPLENVVSKSLGYVER